MTTDKTALDALLPCPFCGGNPQSWADPYKNWIVSCSSCACGTSGDHDKFYAYRAWNTRAALAPVDVEGKIKSILSVVQYDSRDAVEKDLRMLLAPVGVEGLANYIRTIDGNNTMGAGELAEKITDHLAARGCFGVPDSEWFFRWIARGKAGYAGMTMEQCADMIWYSPDNPYRENNPWAEAAPKKEGV